MSFVDPDRDSNLSRWHTPVLTLVIFASIFGVNMLAGSFGGGWVIRVVGSALVAAALVGGRVAFNRLYPP